MRSPPSRVTPRWDSTLRVTPRWSPTLTPHPDASTGVPPSRYSRLFHEHVLAPLERRGVDFWWLDWQQGEAQFAGSAVPEANPTFWLNHVYGTQPDGRSMPHRAAAAPTAVAAADEPQPTRRRRLIMHRWGGLGNQRYPIGFSGDVTSSWASLAFQPLFTSSAANVNFGYWCAVAPPPP